jgi:hypothetical protein
MTGNELLIEMLSMFDESKLPHEQHPRLKLHGAAPNMMGLARGMIKVLSQVSGDKEKLNTAFLMLTQDMLAAAAFMYAIHTMPGVGEKDAELPAGDPWAARTYNERDNIVRQFEDMLRRAVGSVILPVSARGSKEELDAARKDPTATIGRMHIIVPMLRMLDLITDEEYRTMTLLRDEALDEAVDKLIERLHGMTEGVGGRMN